ncbi:Hydroxylamine reductase, partial [Candida maltosa Xu316]
KSLQTPETIITPSLSTVILCRKALTPASLVMLSPFGQRKLLVLRSLKYLGSHSVPSLSTSLPVFVNSRIRAISMGESDLEPDLGVWYLVI